MITICTKKYVVEECTTENKWYSIRVYDGARLVEEIYEPTMEMAKNLFEMMGYKKEQID